MSDETADEAAEEAAGEEPPKKSGAMKLVLLIVLPLLVLGGAGVGLFASGMLDSLLGVEQEMEEEHVEVEQETGPTPGFYYELPDMVVNLNSGRRRQNFLKLSVSLELGSERDVSTVEQVLPRIIDNFQVYLRELRIEDLRGSAGLYRLREELQRRVSAAAAPADVRDVLFREMLVQ